MAAGDHLRCKRTGFWHHGIDCGDGTVIHFADVRPTKANGRVKRTSLAEFEQGVQATVVRYGRCDPPEVVLVRAQQVLGTGGYDLVDHNCEHIARWCKTGRKHSSQVQAAIGHAGSAGATTAFAATGVWLVQVAGVVRNLSGPGILSGLASIGDLLGLGAAGGLAMFGTTTAVSTATILNRTLFADDPFAPNEVRRANSAARKATIAGAAIGVVMTIWLVSFGGRTKGLSGPGISSGLYRLGRLLAGGMVAGFVVVVLVPMIVALVFGLIAKAWTQRPALAAV